MLAAEPFGYQVATPIDLAEKLRHALRHRPSMLALSVPPALAQSPFDGTYTGVSRVSSARGHDLAGKAGTHVGSGCPWVSGVPAPFSVHNGIVQSKVWSGSVDPSGAISVQNRYGDRVAGTISGDTIHADYQGTGCSVSFVWQRRP